MKINGKQILEHTITESHLNLKSLTITSTTDNSLVFDVSGVNGQLFSITDNLVGDIFTVSDISGMPILNVNSNETVNVYGTLDVSTKITNSVGELVFSDTLVSPITLSQIAGVLSTSGTISTETSQRISTDSVLSSAISTEISQRNSNVSSLSIVVSTSLSAAVSLEVSLRTSTDTVLSNGISTEASSRSSTDIILSTGISTEASSRISSNTILSSGISQRTSTDVVLSSGISSEASSRVSTDSVLSTTISTVSSQRTSVDTVLSTSISTEESLRNYYIQSLSNSINVIPSLSTTVGSLSDTVWGLYYSIPANLSSDMYNLVSLSDYVVPSISTAVLSLSDAISPALPSLSSVIIPSLSNAISTEESLRIYNDSLLGGSISGITYNIYSLSNSIPVNLSSNMNNLVSLSDYLVPSLSNEVLTNDGSYPITYNTNIGAINQSLTPNVVYDIQKQLTGTLTLTINSSGRRTNRTNDYMVKFPMGSLQTIIHPTNVRWSEGVLPYISISKTYFCTYTENLIWTKNLYVSSGSAIAGTTWNSQRYTMSFTPSGAGILTALQAITTVTFYKATTNITASVSFFTSSMVGLHIYLGTSYAGQIQSITSTTVAVVSTSGTIGSVGSQQSGSIGGYISSSVTTRQEFTFLPTISGAYLTASTNFTVTVVNGGSVQFEAREFASPYLATNTETQQTIYIGSIETI